MLRLFRLAVVLAGLSLPGAVLDAQQEPTQPKPQEQVPSLDPGEEEGYQWMLRQRAYPLGYIPTGAGIRALRQVESMERQGLRQLSPGVQGGGIVGGNWTLAGPAPLLANFATADLPAGGTNYFGGSVWALAVDPRSASTVYLGGAGGGVWKTTDGGANWNPLTDAQPWLSIGALAIAPSNPDIVYAGTGWPFGIYGEGILKTADAGATWTYVPGPFASPSGPDNVFGGGAKIVALSVHPTNSSIVLAAVWGWGASRGGIFRSTDGGNTWTPTLSSGRGSAVFFYPGNGNIAYAALGDNYGSSADGVYRSADAGLTWTLSDGTGANVLPTLNVGNILLTPALSSPTTMYAAVFQSGSANFLGFYKTQDGGQNWIQPSTLLDLPADPPQTMVVNPANPLVILTGSHDYINRSIDGGATWTRAIPPRFTDNRYFIYSADASRFYIGDDAGVYSTDSPEGPFRMTNLNRTLPLVLYYPGLSIHPTDPSIAFGGAQDLGISRYRGSSTWDWVYNCDGGSTAIDPTTPSTVYATCQSTAAAFIIKSTTGGNTGSWTAAQTGIGSTDKAIFIPPLTMDPGNSQRLYFGATRVYQTNNGAANWQAMSPALTTDTSGFTSISTIAVSPNSSDYVYAGTAGGNVYVSQNATLGTSSSWVKVTTGLPGRAVTAIAAHPTFPGTAYISYSGFSGFGDSLGHIFKTIDSGAHWQDVSSNLPNIPLNDCVVDPDISGTLYAASDMGVFVSANDGVSWSLLGIGLPRVIVHSLRLHRPSRTLRAATFGRSMWDIAVPAGGTIGPTLSAAKSHVGTFQQGQNGATYQVTVSNQSGAGATSGVVTVTDTPPAGLTVASMSGVGWMCPPGNSCTRSDVLAGGASYAAITVTVNVASNAASPLTNQITVSGGGSAPATATDLTVILPLPSDFNRDGHPDVIWQDPVSGLAQVWFLGGPQGITVTGAANLTASNTWRIVGVGDFNRDGNPDVVWQDPVTGAAQVWFLGGAQGNVVTGAAALSTGNSWRIRSVADFNGDGQPDCIWQDQVTGLAQIWFMGGAQGATVIGAVNLTASNTWRIAGTGDFNQDGRPDVVWQDPVSGAMQIWYLGGAQGNVVMNAVNLTSANTWRIAAVSDFNGDGHPDVVLQDPVSGTSQIWFLSGAQGTTIAGTAPMSGANAWRIAGPR